MALLGADGQTDPNRQINTGHRIQRCGHAREIDHHLKTDQFRSSVAHNLRLLDCIFVKYLKRGSVTREAPVADAPSHNHMVCRRPRPLTGLDRKFNSTVVVRLKVLSDTGILQHVLSGCERIRHDQIRTKRHILGVDLPDNVGTAQSSAPAPAVRQFRHAPAYAF